MRNRGETSFGGLMSMLAGALLFVGIGSYIFWPGEMVFVGGEFYSLVLRYAALYRFTYLTLAASALASLAAVLAIKDLLHPDERGLMRWTSLLALIGFAVSAVNFPYVQSQVIQQARNYRDQHISYNGIGLFLDKDSDGNITLAPYPDGPAARAGIQTGDVLVKMDGQALPAGASLDAISAQMQMAQDTVGLTVRSGDQAERDVVLARDVVRIWDVAVQKSLQASGLPNLDPNYLIGFGLPGLWLLILNTRALRQKSLPGLLAGLGLASGLAYWLFVAGFLTDISALMMAGQFGGLALGPIWFIWMGIRLRQRQA
jgi:hypothetical protein